MNDIQKIPFRHYAKNSLFEVRMAVERADWRAIGTVVTLLLLASEGKLADIAAPGPDEREEENIKLLLAELEKWRPGLRATGFLQAGEAWRRSKDVVVI